VPDVVAPVAGLLDSVELDAEAVVLSEFDLDSVLGGDAESLRA
jgi:hypothetical protein